MAIYRPDSADTLDVKTSNPGDFRGVQKVALVKFEDKSDKFDWCDFLIDFHVQTPISKFPDKGSLIITFDKDSEGKLVHGSEKNGRALKKLYNFIDTIGCTLGVDVYGNWINSNGDRVESIEEYLNKNHTTGDLNQTDYFAYIYKEAPKQQGGKSYTKVHHKMYKSRAGNDTKLQDDVNWLKEKGYLKEATHDSFSAPKRTDDVSDLPFDGIGNL